MPLRDHFHSPVSDTHSWDEVHGQWPGEIVRDLRNILPAGFRAAPNVHLGSGFEIVTTYEAATAPETDEGPTGTLATLAPTLTVEADLSEQDEYEVLIYDTEHGRVLVAAIEIVSPSNKDRPASREVFVGKLATLLQQGICVSVVDLVSARQANLYGELLELIGETDPALTPEAPAVYAAACRGTKKDNTWLLETWTFPVAVGQPLPALPLWLADNLAVPLELESSYEETCRILRIP